MEYHYKTAKMLTNLLENKFVIGRFRFGLDPIIGVIPGFGDLLASGLSLYIVWIAMRIQLPSKLLFKMVGNIIIDFLIGLFPVIGDFTDLFFKANSRNLRIIEQYYPDIIGGNVVS